MPDDTPSECGHHWGDRGFLQDPHVCIKPLGHDLDPTNDDHRCCCGNSTWVTQATR